MHKKVVGTLILIRTTLFYCFLVFVLKPQRGGMCIAYQQPKSPKAPAGRQVCSYFY